MAHGITFSFVAEEIVAPGTDLLVKIARPFQHESIKRAIRLQQGGQDVLALVSINESDNTVKVSTQGISPGRYTVQVAGLLDDQGNDIEAFFEMPIRVNTLYGKVLPDHRVEYASRVAMGKTSLRHFESGKAAPPGYRYVEFVKTTHRATGRGRDVTFYEDGTEVDGTQLIKDFYLSHFEEFGVLQESLHHSVASAHDADKFEAVVFPRIEHDIGGYEKPSEGEVKEMPPAAKAILAKTVQSRELVVEKLQKIGAPIKQSAGETLVVRATLTAAQIRGLAKDKAIGGIYGDDSTSVPDLSLSMGLAHAPPAHALGVRGAGVRVAVWENGPEILTNLDFRARFLTVPDADDHENHHSRLTSAIIKNVEPHKPHGYAPDCDLYSANSSDWEALRWALSSPQWCSIVNQSFHDRRTEGEASHGNLSVNDIYEDYLILQFPWPLIVTASGNGGATQYVNHMGFNTLTVGSHNTMASGMASVAESVFKNPTGIRGDRELPEICAYGDGVGAVDEFGWGTSFAAPAVAGTAALMQSVDTTLKIWPEGCRAILLAGADRNVTGGTWGADVGRVDGKDGAGALNSMNAVMIARSRVHQNNRGEPQGWDVGTLRPHDFSADLRSTFRYFVKVPPWSAATGPVPYTVKVAVAWDAKTTQDAADKLTGSALINDLDMRVFDPYGNRVASSSSSDNSYEIAEFRASPDTTYEIVLINWRWTGPSDSSVWYGIAWNITTPN